jgi:ATP-dependent DNA ligase
MAFDLLYVNDRSVMSLTGEQRMLMLKRCIKPKVTHHTPHTTHHTPHQHTHTHTHNHTVPALLSTFHFCDSPLIASGT